jgi:hypothetical protein
MSSKSSTGSFVCAMFASPHQYISCQLYPAADLSDPTVKFGGTASEFQDRKSLRPLERTFRLIRRRYWRQPDCCSRPPRRRTRTTQPCEYIADGELPRLLRASNPQRAIHPMHCADFSTAGLAVHFMRLVDSGHATAPVIRAAPDSSLGLIRTHCQP